jgi:streptogramin lyase/tRNA A-37 threonylcarbamoyl transferase component Bud32
MSVETDRLLGSELAGYRIESVLGRGGMGVVYQAEDLRLKRRVALKLVAPELAADARFRERFLREAELAASLDHSHVVPVHAAGETNGQLWMAMRYVQGTDLKSLLEREGPLEPARALELCSQVAEALDAAHVLGLIHRDVKPANVLVTEEGGREHCYLTDFGLARSPEAEPEADHDPGSGRHLSGTVDYTAPEQIAREPADHRADIYSLGCVLYECLAGKPPFSRPRPTATLFAHASEPPPSLRTQQPDLPEAIDPVITRALAKSPEDRYQTCGELAQAAREALGLDAPRFTRRQLVLAGSGAALAIAAAAAIPTILLSRDEEAAPPAILPLAGDSAVRIDPVTSRLDLAVDLGATPDAVAMGEGAVWVAAPDEQAVLRIDAATGTLAERIDVSGATRPGVLAAGEGALWIGQPSSRTDLWRYDPVTGSLTRVKLPTGISPDQLATADGAVWVGCDVLLRVSPSSNEVELELDFAASPSHVAAGDGTLWAAGAEGHPLATGNSLVWEIDPATGETVSETKLELVVSDLAVGEGAAWVVSLDQDSVTRIDLATKQVSEGFSVGRSPAAVRVGAGAVWVTSERDGTVTRFDPATADVRTIDIGGTPTGIGAGDDAVWVGVRIA